MDNSSFLILDSGVGGLNVLKSLYFSEICADLYYLSDSVNAPYGEKNNDFLYCRAEYLFEKYGAGKNGLILACNTLSTVCLERLKRTLDVPVYGVFPDPPQGRTLYLCTKATASSEYMKTIARKRGVVIVTPEGLVGAIEDNVGAIIRGDFSSVERFLPENDDYDSVVLGCTHFIYLKEFCPLLYPNARILDGTSRLIENICSGSGKNVGKLTHRDHGQNNHKIFFIGADKAKNNKIYADFYSNNRSKLAF